MVHSHNILFKDVVVTTSVLLVMDFWSFLPFLRGELGEVDFILHTLLLIIYASVIISGFKYLTQSGTVVDKIVLWTIITIFIGIIPSYVEYDQSIIDSARACLRLEHGLFLYFVLRCWRYNVKRLMSILTIISLIWVLIEIGQQFTYPHFWFSGRFHIWNKVDVRMGLYRYYLWGVDFVMIAYAYWMHKLIATKAITNKTLFIIIPIAIFLMAGLLCYGSRKHIYAVLLMCFYFVAKLSVRKGLKVLVVPCVCMFLLYLTFYEDYRLMNEEAADVQGRGEDFIRWIEAKYFLFDFSDSMLYPLWGAGLEVSGSKLGHILNDLSYMKIYQADCGIIGYYSKFGLLGVSAIVWYIIFFIRKYSKIQLWLHGFFIMKLLLIVFDFWAIWDVGMCAYSIFLYFLYCNLKEKRLVVRLK